MKNKLLGTVLLLSVSLFDVAIGESTVYDSTSFRPAPFVCPVEQSQNLTLYLEFQPRAEKVRLSIPRGYFDPRLTLRDNRTRRGQVLRIHGETFEPWPPELLPVSKSGPYVGLLLTEYNPLEQVAESLANLSLGYSISDTPDYRVADAIFDLETLVSDKQPYRDYDVYKMDLFIVRNDLGLITDVITCKKPESVPSPSCQQYMESPLVDFSFYYSRKLLEHWQILSRNAQAFVSCITTTPS
ncbi:MAG: hypothetical protein JKY41_13710 [Rhodobacteraceae bacterium]|nr:hypothetical protein [Paracoccaceae bacterium]